MRHRHDELVFQTLVISCSVIMRDESTHSSPRRGLAEKNQFVKTLRFQRSKEPFQVCVQVWASRRQTNRLHALVTQEVSKRPTERRVAVHDQVLLVLEKAVLMVGQFEGDRFHPNFVRIGGAARELDASGFQPHDKEQIESGQAILGPYFNSREVD